MTKKDCPLCGKPTANDQNLCEECQDHVDNQYKSDLLDNEEVKNIIPEQAKETTISANPPTHHKKKNTKTILFVVLGCILLVVVGFWGALKVKEQRESDENEEAFWYSCIMANSPLAYAKYLVAYQDGKYAYEAYERIRALRIEEDSVWYRIKKSTDINDFYNYLSENPNTPYLKKAKQIMDSISWNNVSTAGTADAYLSYLDNVQLGNLPGKYEALAKEKYNYLSNLVTLKNSALDSIKNNISSFYLALSMLDSKGAIEYLSPQLFMEKDSVVNSDIITYQKKCLVDKKLKSLKLQADRNSIEAIKDNNGITFVSLKVNEERVRLDNKKNYAIVSINLELDRNNKIRRIEKSKK